MRKINVLFIHGKKIKNKTKVITLGDMIEKQVPDTYEIDYVSVKDNVIAKINQFQLQIIYILAGAQGQDKPALQAQGAF